MPVCEAPAADTAAKRQLYFDKINPRIVSVPDRALDVLATESSQMSIVLTVGEYDVYGTEAVK